MKLAPTTEKGENNSHCNLLYMISKSMKNFQSSMQSQYNECIGKAQTEIDVKKKKPEPIPVPRIHHLSSPEVQEAQETCPHTHTHTHIHCKWNWKCYGELFKVVLELVLEVSLEVEGDV